MAIVVEVVGAAEQSVLESTNKAVVIEIVSTFRSPTSTTAGAAVVEVSGPPIVKNAVVSAVPPPDPYQHMIWIDIS